MPRLGLEGEEVLVLMSREAWSMRPTRRAIHACMISWCWEGMSCGGRAGGD